jgi:ribonuclease HI
MPIHDDAAMLESVTIYTDGAVSGNGTVGSYGGWAVVFVLGKHELEFSGAERGTTNQRMELRAAIEGLRALRRPSRVTLYCDSSYVVECFLQGWWRRWLENGWRSSKRQPVGNRALWEELLELTTVHQVTWVKVKGHSDDELNSRCDQLAVAARERLAAEFAEAAAEAAPAELDEPEKLA